MPTNISRRITKEVTKMKQYYSSPTLELLELKADIILTSRQWDLEEIPVKKEDSTEPAGYEW